MARKRRTSSSAPPRVRPSRSSRRKRRTGRQLAGRLAVRGFIVALILLAGYTAWLDSRVRVQFEGKRWALPARVYARPLELWPGSRITPDALEAELRHAGYLRATGSGQLRPGSYRRARGQFIVAAREFPFWDGDEPARQIEIRFTGRGIGDIVSRGESIPLVRLEPALIGRIYPGHHEDRIMLRLAEAPPELVEGVLAVEDRGFFEHHGVSPRAIARAAWANLRALGVVQGASTLNQQLAKNFFLTPEQTVWRKFTEAIMAVLLDLRYSKEDLLETYLNEVYLGQEGRRAIHGFGLAARFYFGRRVDELDLSETALLIGLVRGASAYNPRRQPERAKARRDLVLDLMAGQEVITPAQAERAKARPLGVLPEVPRGASPHPAFVDLVRRQLARDYRDTDLRTEGLRIFTTLDPVLQLRAEEALTRGLDAAERRRRLLSGELQGALIAARADNGEVVALVGGRQARIPGFNRALDARRPIGSLAKPLVYLAALERGHTLASPVEDAPVNVTLDDGRTWNPRNHDGRYLGTMPLFRALALSRNAATTRLGLEVGVERVAEMFERLGANGPIRPLPSLLLGALSQSPFEVAQLYQGLANEGFLAPLRGIREVTGTTGQPRERYGLAVDPAAPPADIYLLRVALEAVLREGTGRRVGSTLPASLHPAGKTGTTDEGRDSWFAGFAGGLVVVAWVGYDDNRAANLSGAGQALRVWADFVSRLPPPQGAGAPVPPADVEWQWVKPGKRPFVTESDCPGALSLPFRAATAPPYRPC